MKFFEGLKERGKATPLDEVPQSDYSFSWYMEAYSLLMSSTNMNGVIPLSEILTYTNNFELIASRDEFIKVIQALNGVNLKESQTKQKQKQKENPKPKHRPR